MTAAPTGDVYASKAFTLQFAGDAVAGRLVKVAATCTDTASTSALSGAKSVSLTTSLTGSVRICYQNSDGSTYTDVGALTVLSGTHAF